MGAQTVTQTQALLGFLGYQCNNCPKQLIRSSHHNVLRFKILQNAIKRLKVTNSLLR
jgi:hypothetical protein